MAMISRIFMFTAALVLAFTTAAMAFPMGGAMQRGGGGYWDQPPATRNTPPPADDDDRYAAKNWPPRPKWFRGFNPFFAPYYDPRLGNFATCDRNPKLCGAWSGGMAPDCCGKMCTNLQMDFFNCGQCGKTCRFGQTCCGGKCVNLFYDAKHCGFCNNACESGGFCQFGMCNYAS